MSANSAALHLTPLAGLVAAGLTSDAKASNRLGFRSSVTPLAKARPTRALMSWRKVSTPSAGARTVITSGKPQRRARSALSYRVPLMELCQPVERRRVASVRDSTMAVGLRSEPAKPQAAAPLILSPVLTVPQWMPALWL